MSQIIKFINRFEFEQDYLPEPASKNIPDWYKDAPSYSLGNKMQTGIKEENGASVRVTNATIKKCMPVFDAMSVGYIIKVPADIEVYKTKNGDTTATAFSWTWRAPVKQHPMEQIVSYPHNGVHKFSIPKFLNPWIIVTPPGYSCLFVSPMHRDSKFNILPGIVDTDNFDHAVNFPFMLNDSNFEGKIEAGTPMAQVIPFKRDNFSYELYNVEEYIEKYPETTIFTEEFPESYKKNNWNKKNYK